MRSPYKREFFQLYKQAFKLYIKGNWDEAKSMFEETLTHAPNPEKEPVT